VLGISSTFNPVDYIVGLIADAGMASTWHVAVLISAVKANKVLVRKAHNADFTLEYTVMTDGELTFFRWARLRDFIEINLALRRPEVRVFIAEGYLEQTDAAVILTEKGKEALRHEPAV
jgi:hypothetical protein